MTVATSGVSREHQLLRALRHVLLLLEGPGLPEPAHERANRTVDIFCPPEDISFLEGELADGVLAEWSTRRGWNVNFFPVVWLSDMERITAHRSLHGGTGYLCDLPDGPWEIFQRLRADGTDRDTARALALALDAGGEHVPA